MAQVTLTNDEGLGLDTRDFARFTRALRKAQPILAKELRSELRAAGALVADEAKSIIGEVSQSIPPTIKVRLSGATVSVVAGGKDNTIAGLLEQGRGRASSGSFRHPVFGNMDVWVSQKTHPFLAPALVRKSDAAFAGIVNALDKATHAAATL